MASAFHLPNLDFCLISSRWSKKKKFCQDLKGDKPLRKGPWELVFKTKQDKKIWQELKEKACLGKNDRINSWSTCLECPYKVLVVKAEWVSLCEHLFSSHSKWSAIHKAWEQPPWAEQLYCLKNNFEAALATFVLMIADVLKWSSKEGHKSKQVRLVWKTLYLVEADFPSFNKENWYLSSPNVPSAERAGK